MWTRQAIRSFTDIVRENGARIAYCASATLGAVRGEHARVFPLGGTHRAGRRPRSCSTWAPLRCGAVPAGLPSAGDGSHPRHGTDARSPGGAMPPASTPNVGSAVGVAVVAGFLDRVLYLLPGLEKPAGESEGPQRLPPGLNEVEVGGVLSLRFKYESFGRIYSFQQKFLSRCLREDSGGLLDGWVALGSSREAPFGPPRRAPARFRRLRWRAHVRQKRRNYPMDPHRRQAGSLVVALPGQPHVRHMRSGQPKLGESGQNHPRPPVGL